MTQTNIEPVDFTAERLFCRQIHHALIPQTLPSIEGIDISSLFLPCESTGGDLFDAVAIDSDLLAFYIMDVALQGYQSTLIAALVKNIWREQIRLNHAPQVVLKRISDTLSEIDAEFYLTLFIGVLNLHINKLTYSNAGHPQPLVLRSKDASLVTLDTHGPFLGRDGSSFFARGEFMLNPGDSIICFSDGLYDLLGNGDVVAGRNRLHYELNQNTNMNAARFVDWVKSRHTCNPQPEVLDDDVTAIAIEILSQSRKDQIKQRLGFNPADPVYLQFLSYYEEMDSAVTPILKQMDQSGFSDEDIRRMKITLIELCANAIGHGNHDDHTKKVTVGHLIDNACAVIAVMDEGEGYDIAEVKDPTLEENLTRDHGRGLYIVRNYVDEFQLNQRGTRVLIRKFRK